LQTPKTYWVSALPEWVSDFVQLLLRTVKCPCYEISAPRIMKTVVYLIA
jgi:hypothetical protein